MTKILIAAIACLTAGVFTFGNLVFGEEASGTDPVPSRRSPPTTTAADRPVLSGSPARVAVSSTPSIVTIGADSEDRARLLDALDRFRDHGLDLPDLQVRFHDDETDCRGHYGLFQPSFEPWRLLICSDLPFVPTHELAHAWEAANLSDHDRAGYVEARGLSNWNDPAAAWGDRGVEEVAFMIQQNLTATKPSLTSATWIERIDAYELVTGQRSPLRAAS